MIHTDTMELIIKNQQEQIKGLLETNRTLVESNQKTYGTDGRTAAKSTGTPVASSLVKQTAFRQKE
ncbi:hypothetical protein KGMB02408_42930 [Bacteroides faecalis]|uniref:Uncharacterized protein n=1 Tax=Bacteroides faecalis TaxID=2447885 RepID=A0A401M0R4_9BACE|nr:hypothetical protein KGMB02408_42930 [Bacteroides faecalis]